MPPALSSTRPLVLTADPVMLEELLRIAAVAGAEVEVADSAPAARASWSASPLVVVCPDLLARCAGAGLPRRPGVVLLGTDLDDAAIWQRAVELGAEHVVFLPDAESWLLGRFTDAAEPPVDAARVLGVVGARGGAGATALSVALALAGVTRGARTWLIDGDPWGGGIDLVLGGEHAPGVRWPELAQARGRVSGASLAAAVPVLHGISVLSWTRSDEPPRPDLAAPAVPVVLQAARRSSDLVVVDLARQPSAWETALLPCLDTCLLVVPQELRATAAAAQLVSRLEGQCAEVLLVARGPAPAGLSPHDVERTVGLPLIATMRQQPGLARLLESGEPPGAGRGPLADTASTVLDALLPVRHAA